MLPRRARMDLGAMAMKGVLRIPQGPSKTSSSGCLVSYPGHSLGGGLPLCRGAVSVFYSPSRQGNHFCVFGMTRPGIEPRSSGPLANTLLRLIWDFWQILQFKKPNTWCLPQCIYIYIYTHTHTYIYIILNWILKMPLNCIRWRDSRSRELEVAE